MEAKVRDFTGEDVKRLREERGQDQLEFGRELWATEDGSSPRQRVSMIENGHRPVSQAVERTLIRMVEGEI